MPNILLGMALLLITFLPSSNTTNYIKGKLEAQILPAKNIDDKNSESEQIIVKPIPEKTPSFQNISSGSRAALFIDYNSGEILYAKNEKQKVPMASTTKLMTALLVEEFLEPEKVVVVQPYTLRPLDSVMGVPIGTKIKVRELLHGLLIESGSDAAQALSKEVSGTEQKFVALMNERAKIYGLDNTQFTNSVGYDDKGHYSTAEDLIKLSRIALMNKQILEIADKHYYIAAAEDGQKFSLENTNKLLGYAGYSGLKTGTTFEAGECLIAVYTEGERKIIGVVLNSPDRFGEAKNIINWAKENFTW